MINNDFINYQTLDYKYRFVIPNKYLENRSQKEVLTVFKKSMKIDDYRFDILEIPLNNEGLEKKITKNETNCKDFPLKSMNRITLGTELCNYLNIEEDRSVAFYLHNATLYLGQPNSVELYSEYIDGKNIEKLI